jgi:hypothetical protein
MCSLENLKILLEMGTSSDVSNVFQEMNTEAGLDSNL